MRTLGSPSASTVASDMAVGSRGSPRAASSNQAANSRNGSSAAVKSPVVNQVGCSIGADSDILRSDLGGGVVAKGPVAKCYAAKCYAAKRFAAQRFVTAAPL